MSERSRLLQGTLTRSNADLGIRRGDRPPSQPSPSGQEPRAGCGEPCAWLWWRRSALGRQGLVRRQVRGFSEGAPGILLLTQHIV